MDKEIKEKLIIKNFGPIKSVDLDLGKITILIGENASGKSTAAKVLAVCRYFSYIAGELGKPYSNFFSIGIDSWGLGSYIKSDSYISYDCYHYSLKSSVRRSTPTPEGYQNPPYLGIDLTLVSKEFKELHYKYITFDRGILNKISPLFYQNEVSKVMDNPFYLPTERGLQSIFSLGKNSLQNISDSLFNQFARLDQVARFFKPETNITPLDITYKNDNGKGFIKRDQEEDYYSVSNAASGYQSTIPVVLLIKYYSEFKKKKKTFIIEEPELNLFPKAQKKLIEFLTSSVKEFNHSLLLTTHSPYILTALENLMYANKLGTMDNGKYKNKVTAIVDEKYWIPQEDINVYYLGEEKEEDLMQRDDSLINKDFIDGVSEIINNDFDKLLSIEIASEKVNGQDDL